MSSASQVKMSPDPQDFDLEELVHLEQTFYNAGYEDGYAHGRLHGLIEGRALGAEKGFELWEELGFYEGTARLWTAVSSTDSSGTQARGAHHASALLALIGRFPRTNPRPDEEGIDMSAQLRLIRSRYKAMCASLGVRARLMPAPAPAPAAGAGAEAEDGPGSGEGALVVAATDATAGSQDSDADAAADVGVGTEKRRPKRQPQKKTVWPLAGPASASAQAQGFSF